MGRLEHLLQESSMTQSNAFMLNMITLQSAEINWRAYLNDIQEQCRTLVCTRKSCEGVIDLLYNLTVD